MTDRLQFPIFDGHNDTLEDLCPPGGEEGRSFFARSDKGHIDLPRAREGGFAGGLFAIFVPAEPESPGGNDLAALPELCQAVASHFSEVGHFLGRTLAMMATLYRLEAESEGHLQVVRTADEIRICLREGVLAAVLHFEGAEAIGPDPEALGVFYEAGLRSLGLVWSRSNSYGHGVIVTGFPSSPDTGPGLSDTGKVLVRACNQLGVVVDLSHLNEKGFWDVAAISDAPLVASHSCAHALCPSARNLTDRQLAAIGDSGGVVGVNFHVGFLRADGDWDAETPLAEIVRHVDYIAERIGIEHVALGSDFDGATMPQDLGDVAGLPRLVAALRARGYSDAELTQISHENWLRVLGQTWR